MAAGASRLVGDVRDGAPAAGFEDDEHASDFVGPDRDPPPAAKVAFAAKSAPEGAPTDRMAIRFGPEDACNTPYNVFTAALAVCGEAMMLQLNLAEERTAPSDRAGLNDNAE
jgi:hypothetical protein